MLFGLFFPVSGLPPAGLSLAVLRSWLVLIVFSVRQCCEGAGRVFVWMVPAMTVSYVVEECLNIRRRCDELLPGGWVPRLTLLVSSSVLY